MKSRYLGVLGADCGSAADRVTGRNRLPRRASSAPSCRRPSAHPGRSFPVPQSCSPQYQRLLKLQADGMRQLQRLSRGEGETLCSTLESADLQGIDKLVDPKALEPLLTPDQRDLLGAFGIDLGKVNVAKIMQRLGIDPVTGRSAAAHSSSAANRKAGIDRFAASELGRAGERDHPVR